MHETQGTRVSGCRPLKSRQMAIFQETAAWLATTSVTPNVISVSSMLFAAIAAIAMVGTAYAEDRFAIAGLWLAAAAMMQARLIANLLDGMVAVEGGKSSPVGDLYNEVPDRISDSLILMGAGFATGGISDLGWGAAIISVFVAYVRALGANLTNEQYFAGPMAKPQRMAIMTITSVLLAILAATDLTADLSRWLLNGALILIIFGGALTSARRLHFIALHLRNRSGGQP